MTSHRTSIIGGALAAGVGLFDRRIAGHAEVLLDMRHRVPAPMQAVTSTVEPKRVIEQNSLAAMHGRPHYSDRETERRRRQIERGQLKAENGLDR